MPTQKPRFMVTVSEELLQQIDDYRFSQKCKTQTQAINELINLGIARLAPDLSTQTKKEPAALDGLSDKEREFIRVFQALSPSNQHLLLGIGALILQEQGKHPD